MIEWIGNQFGRVIYTWQEANLLRFRTQQALDALEIQGEDGLHAARSCLYELLGMLK